MEESHKTHRPHIKVGKDEEQKERKFINFTEEIFKNLHKGWCTYLRLNPIFTITSRPNCRKLPYSRILPNPVVITSNSLGESGAAIREVELQ